MTDSDLYRQRSEAVEKFLQDNAELFAADSEDLDIEGPQMITGAILILRARYAGGEGELCVSINVPYGLGLTEEMGMLARETAVCQHRLVRDD